MTLNRRQFLSSGLPMIAAAGATSAEAFATTKPEYFFEEKNVSALTDADTLVLFSGDALPQLSENAATNLQALLHKHSKLNDNYLSGGAVAQLETKFSALLGKEESVFMPTGTMANHIALRLLCGEARHALVQQESHVYRDESNSVTTLSGINVVPLAPGKAAPTMSELKEAIDRAEIGPYPIKVGAISIESPVRRAKGATLPASLIAEIAKLARSKHIPLHLDGARLLLMSGLEGFNVKAYCEPFDTVYVSLYKYLGAPYGAILAGPKVMMEKARELRHIFGGTVSHGWQAALPALDALEGFEQRFAQVHRASDRFLAKLDRTTGFKVQRVEHGSNIAFLEISEKRQIGFEQRLKDANIRTGKVVDGKLMLQFNESLLRRDTDYLLAAFVGPD
jgi:threonine aldolase